MEEIWKDIKGYEGKYQVSNFGRVRSLNRLKWNGRVYCNQKGKIMSQSSCRIFRNSECEGYEKAAEFLGIATDTFQCVVRGKRNSKKLNKYKVKVKSWKNESERFIN